MYPPLNQLRVAPSVPVILFLLQIAVAFSPPCSEFLSHRGLSRTGAPNFFFPSYQSIETLAGIKSGSEEELSFFCFSSPLMSQEIIPV